MASRGCEHRLEKSQFELRKYTGRRADYEWSCTGAESSYKSARPTVHCCTAVSFGQKFCTASRVSKHGCQALKVYIIL